MPEGEVEYAINTPRTSRSIGRTGKVNKEDTHPDLLLFSALAIVAVYFDGKYAGLKKKKKKNKHPGMPCFAPKQERALFASKEDACVITSLDQTMRAWAGGCIQRL
jgi:hypothetical protein